MKKTINIKKHLLEPPIDFDEMLKTKTACGVRLEAVELPFMQFEDGAVVMFDAYSSAHKCGAFDFDGGVVAFPICLCCMTDGGERVAYAGLRFGDERITKWRLCYDRDDKSAIGRLTVDPDAASVSISSGVCCISDTASYGLYRTHIRDEIHPLAGQIILNGMTHSVIELYGKKYAVFSSGWGDGKYKCYVGQTDDGRTMAFVADFGMIEYPKPTDETVPVEIDASDIYVFDPAKTEAENNIARWTQALDCAATPTDRLRAYSRRGFAYHSYGNIDAALGDYERAIAECRDINDRQVLLAAWSVYDNAAELYIKKSDYESAIAVMKAALDVGDNFYIGAYTRLIDLYQLTKNTEMAAELGEKLYNKRINDPVACMKFAEVCVSAMDYARAAKLYARLADEFKLYENIFDEVSCLIELGMYDKADAALETHPAKENNEQYWYYKAYIDFKNKKYSDALDKAERSHALDPEYMPALYMLIDIETLVQEFHAVARYAEEYKRLRPDKEYGYSVCAAAHLMLGNFSECSRNYFYLYENIKHDDKYAALAAVTAAKMGDVKRKSSILKRLRRKKSAYYYGAIYAIYIKRRGSRDAELSKVVYKLKADDDFLLNLAAYLTESGDVLAAARLLQMLSRHSPSAEIVAQQARTAARLGDDKLFKSFFEFYLANYIGGEVSPENKKLLYNRFTNK